MNSSFGNIIKSQKPVLVDIFASCFGPCKVLGPILKEVKESLGERILILKIDVDKNQQIASQYQMYGAPTMILFENGKQLWRQIGVLEKGEIIKVVLEKSSQ
jgi:thioredoxin 1